MTYYVTATVREVDCNPRSGISQLVLDQAIDSNTVFKIGDLKNIADANQLWVNSCGQVTKVRIFYSLAYGRYIATTRADDVVCDNLLSLPIYRATRRVGETTYFDSCPL